MLDTVAADCHTGAAAGGSPCWERTLDLARARTLGRIGRRSLCRSIAGIISARVRRKVRCSRSLWRPRTRSRGPLRSVRSSVGLPRSEIVPVACCIACRVQCSRVCHVRRTGRTVACRTCRSRVVRISPNTACRISHGRVGRICRSSNTCRTVQAQAQLPDPLYQRVRRSILLLGHSISLRGRSFRDRSISLRAHSFLAHSTCLRHSILLRRSSLASGLGPLAGHSSRAARREHAGDSSGSERRMNVNRSCVSTRWPRGQAGMARACRKTAAENSFSSRRCMEIAFPTCASS